MCRTFSPESDFGPTSAHSLNVSIRNQTPRPYAFDQADWSFFDAAGQAAQVHGWGNPAAPDHDHMTLQPGEASAWFFLAWTFGPDSGNLTHVRFKEGPLQPLAAPALPAAAEGPCWGDFDWRVMYTSPPW
jgi:hypothetical protein